MPTHTSTARPYEYIKIKADPKVDLYFMEPNEPSTLTSSLLVEQQDSLG